MEEVRSQIIKVDFEWKIQLPFQDTVPDCLNLQSTEFSSKESPKRMWLLKIQGSIVELTDSFEKKARPNTNIKYRHHGVARLGFINKNRQKVFHVETKICEILENHCRLEINLKELREKECIVDGYLTVHCEIQEYFVFKEEALEFKNILECEGIYLKPGFSGGDQLVRSPYDTKYEKLFENMELTDVDFDVCGRQFKAHKIVLSRSEEFAAMFEWDTKEKKTNRFVIQDIEPDVFHELLRYIYTGRVPQEKMDRLAVGLLVAADNYLLDRLKTECEYHVVYRMSIDICLDLLLLRNVDFLVLYENNQIQHLFYDAKLYFHVHSEEVMASDRWKETKQKNPILLCDLQKYLICSCLGKSNLHVEEYERILRNNSFKVQNKS